MVFRYFVVRSSFQLAGNGPGLGFAAFTLKLPHKIQNFDRSSIYPKRRIPAVKPRPCYRPSERIHFHQPESLLEPHDTSSRVMSFSVIQSKQSLKRRSERAFALSANQIKSIFYHPHEFLCPGMHSSNQTVPTDQRPNLPSA